MLQRTLTELKRIGNEALGEAHQTILTTREILRNAKAHQKEVRGTIDRFTDVLAPWFNHCGSKTRT